MVALWIDDEPAFARPHIEALKKSGITITACSTIEEALAFLESGEQIEAIITDAHLPSNAGDLSQSASIEFARKIKAKLPHASIIAYSHLSYNQDKAHPFDVMLRKSDMPNSGATLMSEVKESISARIAETEGLDRQFVSRVLKSNDFDIVSDIATKEGFSVASKEYVRCVEVSEQINSLILEQASKQPQLLWSLDDRKFEEICAAILCREGFRVHLTSKSRDGGFDLMAFNHNGFMTSLYLVECKRWHPKPVGVPIVRQLNGVVEQMGASGGIIMATTDFTAPAKRFASQPAVRMDLVDFLKLRSWMEKVRSR